MGFLVWALVCSPCGFGSLLPFSGRFPRVLPEPWLEIQFWGVLGFRRGLSACAREFCALSLFRALPLVSRARFGAWVPVGGFRFPGFACVPAAVVSRVSVSPGFCVSVSPEVLRAGFSCGFWFGFSGFSASQFLLRFGRLSFSRGFRVSVWGSTHASMREGRTNPASSPCRVPARNGSTQLGFPL